MNLHGEVQLPTKVNIPIHWAVNFVSMDECIYTDRHVPTILPGEYGHKERMIFMLVSSSNAHIIDNVMPIL